MSGLTRSIVSAEARAYNGSLGAVLLAWSRGIGAATMVKQQVGRKKTFKFSVRLVANYKRLCGISTFCVFHGSLRNCYCQYINGDPSFILHLQ